MPDTALEALLTESFVQGGFTDPQIATSPFAASAVKARGTVLVACEASGALIGAVTLVRGGSPASRLAGAGEAELHLLCVGPASRGRGIGMALVDSLLGLARAEGVVRVLLWTQPTMRAAQRLYEMAGFHRAAALDFAHRSRTFIVYERVLANEAIPMTRDTM